MQAAAAPSIDMASLPEVIAPGESVRLRGEAAPGATVRVSINDRVVASAIAGESGGFRTTIGFSAPGTYTVTASLVEDDHVAAVSEPLVVTVTEPTPAATEPPTVAPTNTPAATATNTPAPTATNTATNTPAPTATSTPLPTATSTPAPTATNTSAPTATNTTAPTNTPAPTNTNTSAPTATKTNTPEPTATKTNTPAPTATNTPEATATATLAPVAPTFDQSNLPEQFLPGESFRLQGEASPGATVNVLLNDKVVASAVAGASGRFRATVGFAQPGEYALSLQVVDESGNVLAASEPVTLTVAEPTPTVVVPTETPIATVEVAPTVVSTETAVSGVAITPTLVSTETLTVTETTTTTAAAQPGALPGTGVAIDRLGLYNVLLPVAQIAGLVMVTLFQRRRS